MADYRTKPESELTFYVFSQPKGLFGISRYDTIDEAINKFRKDLDIPSDFSGIGVSRYGTSEVDILQKKKDSIAIVTDYKKIETTKYNKDVEDAIRKVASTLGVVWEYNHSILDGAAFSSLCIPCQFDKPIILHNEYIENLTLRPIIMDRLPSAIEKFYVSDKGWCDVYDVMDICRSGEGINPKIESIRVKVEDNDTKKQSTIDISPNDYIIMADNYVLSHQNLFPRYEIQQAIESLAGDLYDFMSDFDTYEYMDNLPEGGEKEVIEQIIDDIQSGNAQSYISELKTILSEDNAPGDSILNARDLLARLSKIPSSELEADLTTKIEKATRSRKISNDEHIKDGYINDRLPPLK